jgi:hypothetical protein
MTKLLFSLFCVLIGKIIQSTEKGTLSSSDSLKNNHILCGLT